MDQHLAALIRDAPYAHKRLFIEHLQDAPLVQQVPLLPPGQLRPVVLAHRWMGFDYASVDVDQLAMLSLYAHQVVAQDPLHALLPTSCDLHEGLDLAIEQLLRLKPIHDAGGVHLIKAPLAFNHAPDVDDVVEVLETMPGLDRGLAADLNLPGPDGTSFRLGWGGPFPSVYWPLGRQQAMFEILHLGAGQLHRLATSRYDEQIQEAFLRLGGVGVGEVQDQRLLSLTTLSRLALPIFTPDTRLVAALRRESEEFANWRSILGVALTQVQGLEVSGQRWACEAAAILDAELEPVRARLQQVTVKSPALSAFRVGGASFSVAALGAVSGATAGESLVGGLLAAAGSAAAEAVGRYFESLRRYRSNMALLDLAVTFRPASSRPTAERG